MASAIDDTVPANGAAGASAPIRSNFATAKSEISALQTAVAAAGDFKSDGTVAMTAALPTNGVILGASNVLEQRNGVNAQALRVYNTYTDASNYERGQMRWSSNVLHVGFESAGTGSNNRTMHVGTLSSGAVNSYAEFSNANGTSLVWNPSGVSNFTQLTLGNGRIRMEQNGTIFFDRNNSVTKIWASIIAAQIVAKTANYTVTANDSVIECDATSAAITLTLPAVASATAGTTYTLKKTDSSANAVIFDGNASETIDGATTVSTTTQWASITIIRNAAGTAWLTLKD